MGKTEDIKLLIDNENESEYLDFKSIQYNKEKFDDMIVDVMSMANSKYCGDKYIILGVKEKQNGSKDILGIPEKEFYDSSIIQNVILKNIEPEIDIDYFPIKYNDLLIGVIVIKSKNINKPYMIKKDYRKLQ
ncbi:MAG: helix-turn-helix domain-containing protein, partial [Sedimentibacter sp.]